MLSDKIHISPRKKEILLTVITNLLLQVITALCGFVLPPLVIEAFGSSVNGMVSSITQFIAYLNIVEAGVGGAAIAALYKPLALGEVSERNAILSATRSFYNRSGLLFTLLVFVLAFVYPMFVSNQVDRFQSVLMVLVLGITGAAEFFLIGKYRVFLTADKKVYVISLVQMVALVISTVLSVILIKIGVGILIVKFASALVYLARYGILVLYVRFHYKNINFHAVPDKKAISQSKNVLVHQISSLIVFNSPLVIITIFCSLKDASVYTIYALVFNGVGLLLGSFSNGMQSFFGESLVTDSPERTYSIFSRYETLFFVAEGWFYAMTSLLIMPFMQLYTKKMTDADYIQPVLASLFVVVGVLNNIRNPSIQLINAAGHFKKTQWRSLIESGINVVVSLTGVFFFGFNGVLLGAIASGLYRGVDVIFYVSRHILHSFSAGIKTVVKVLSICSLFFIFSFILLQKPVYPVSYLQWILLAFVYGMVLVLPCVLFLLCFKVRKK